VPGVAQAAQHHVAQHHVVFDQQDPHAPVYQPSKSFSLRTSTNRAGQRAVSLSRR
jgi:hypothetical protein